jgi:stearoyl-CoA desaturase (delta-9 desaturase)
VNKLKFWAPMYAAFLPIQLAGIYAIYQLFTNAPDYWYVYTILGYIWIMMLGLSACYHRLLSHKSFKVHPLMKRFMLLGAVLSGQHDPLFWVTIHRGYHHRLTDTDRDPHSPKHGFWHSYVLWMFRIREGDMSPKYVVDLMRDPDCLFVHKHYMKIFIGVNLLVYLINPTVWLWLIMFPAFISFHSYAINTSVNHYTKLGYKNYETKDNGINVVWLFPVILGEAWHNNHHGDSGNYNFGGRHWWEFDPTRVLIDLIRID